MKGITEESIKVSRAVCRECNWRAAEAIPYNDCVIKCAEHTEKTGHVTERFYTSSFVYRLSDGAEEDPPEVSETKARFLKSCLELMEPGYPYSKNKLLALWGIGTSSFKYALNHLLDRGDVQAVGGEYVRT